MDRVSQHQMQQLGQQPLPGTPQQQQQQAGERQVTIDARRFERLESNVAKLLELTQLMLNRQQELNDRAQARVDTLQQEVAYAEERLQLALEGSEEEDDDDDSEPPDMAYPPPGMQFRPNFGAKKPLEGLLDNLNLWAKEHGYKCATLRSTQKPGERVRVAIRCALGGEARYKTTDENGETLIRTKTGQLRKPYRKRTSKKTGCQFGFILGETGQNTNIFEVRYHPNGCHPHNHEPMDF